MDASDCETNAKYSFHDFPWPKSLIPWPFEWFWKTNTFEAKVQKNNISFFANLQHEQLVLIFLWFLRFSSTYCMNKYTLWNYRADKTQTDHYASLKPQIVNMTV